MPALRHQLQIKTKVDTTSEEPIADNHFRIHVKTPEEKQRFSRSLTWDDVENHLKNWPNGAKSFKDAKQDDYGYYLDVKLKMIKPRRSASSSTIHKGITLQETVL